MTASEQTESVYQRLNVRPLINARGAITILGGSIMPPQVVEAMAEASRQFVSLEDLLDKAGARIAELTGAEAAHISAGAASGMMLAGAACVTGTDQEAIEALPDTGDRPNEFVISVVDSHYYIHQGFRAAGGKVVKVGTPEDVTAEDYALGITERTAALVFFLGRQLREQLPPVIEIAHNAGLPVIVDAAAQLPPRSNLTEITAMGADLVVFSGGKGLGGPQSSGLVLGRRDLVRACALNGSPNSAIGRGMKVGKEEAAGLLTAVELYIEHDEEAVLREWERRCSMIGEVVGVIDGVSAEYRRPAVSGHPPGPVLHIDLSPNFPLSTSRVDRELQDGDLPIHIGVHPDYITVDPQTLQDGDAEIIASRLNEILRQG